MCSDADDAVGITEGDVTTDAFFEIDHSDAAEAWAEAEFENSAGEWKGDVKVQEIDDQGAPVGEPQIFSIEIDWNPTFSASPRKG